MLEGTSTMHSLQRALSRGQATLIVGPLLVSPVKACVSVAQIAMGLFFMVVCAAACIAFRSPCLGFSAATGFAHAAMGTTSLIYSLANILSFGGIGYSVENRILHSKRSYERFLMNHVPLLLAK